MSEVARLGKYYKLNAKEKIHICSIAETHKYGCCFIAEDKEGKLFPIRVDEDYSSKWEEISREAFLDIDTENKNFKLGRYYRHTNGKKIYVWYVSKDKDTAIFENQHGTSYSVNLNNEPFDGWQEIDRNEFLGVYIRFGGLGV
jgi:hypothetical protein